MKITWKEIIKDFNNSELVISTRQLAALNEVWIAKIMKINIKKPKR